jgi:hypothetical protein
MKREDRNLWQKAIEEEYQQLQEENKAFKFIEWNVFRKLTNQHILGSMLVLTIKRRKADGSIDKYKARLHVLGVLGGVLGVLGVLVVPAEKGRIR